MSCPLLKSFEGFSKCWQVLNHVFTDYLMLERVAKEWAKKEFTMPNWRLPVLPEKDNDDFIQFLGISAALNFCYINPTTKEKFSVDYLGRIWTGAEALNACLMREYEANPEFLKPEFLRNMTLTYVRYLFRNGFGEIPLLEQRWQILNEIGAVLCDCFSGHFKNILKLAGYNAFDCRGYGIVDLLTKNFPSFNDKSFHTPSRSWLTFQKRAQLFVLLYHGRANASGGKLPKINDIYDVGPITDYQVPRSLYDLGILKYRKTLEEKIFAQQEIHKDSNEEIEIRATTFIAASKLLERINELRRNENLELINMCHLDYKLWHAGKKAKIPPHITMTTAY